VLKEGRGPKSEDGPGRCFRSGGTATADGMIQMSLLAFDGGRTILGKISKRGNKYLRTLFVQAAHVVLVRRPSAAMRGLWPWIEQASKRLHRNMLAIALANKLARIA
jgi:Transposase IS116/IS110/IS902 family